MKQELSTITNQTRNFADLGMIFWLVLAGFFVLQPFPGFSAPESVKQTVEPVYNSLINITAIHTRHHGGRATRYRGTGSGIIIGSDGYAVTNYHVVRRAKSVRVTLANRNQVDARVIGSDPLTDIVLLRLDPGQSPYPKAPLGNSAKLQIGEPVFALGSPLALSRSVTAGIVSNTQRTFSRSTGPGMELFDGLRTGMYTSWIQHDASIHPGNSGGPLVNDTGHVIGINQLGNTSGGGLGFAIPINLVKAVTRKLRRKQSITRSWYGITLQSLEDSPETRGVLIGAVSAGSPGDRAGLEPGYRILSVDGREINAMFDEELPRVERFLAGKDPERPVRMMVRTPEGDNRRVKISPERFRDKLGRRVHLPEWGVNLREISWWYARQHQLPVTSGWEVIGIKSGGPAEEASPPLQTGDIIQKINRQSVSGDQSPKTWSENFSGEELLLQVRRNQSELLVYLTPQESSERDSRPRELSRPWLGVKLQVLTPELREQLETDLPSSVRVTEIFEETTASAAGLRVGDIITGVNGESLNVNREHHTTRFFQLLENWSIGSTVDLTVIRDGNRRTVPVELQSSPNQPSEADRFRDRRFGITVREVTFQDRIDHNWSSDEAGVFVHSVESGGWAGLAGIRAGDLLIKLDGKLIQSLDQFETALDRIYRESDQPVPVLVARNQTTRYLYLEPKWHDN